MTTPNGTSGNTAAAGSSTLVRTLNFRDLLLLFIGAVIGSGIFLVPGGVLQQTGGSVALALLVWVIGGVLSLLGALTYAELSAANPTAGGLYCYVRDAFGRFPAFLYGWCLFLVISSGSVAALARAFAIHLAEIVPLSRLEMTIAAVAVVAVVTAVNVWGTRKSSDLLNWMTLIKALVIVILSAVLLSLGRHASESFTANTPAVHGKDLFAGFGLAMIAVLWAYEGWQFATYNAGEALEPQRNFPRSFLAGSLILTGLYLLANLAYLAALGPVAAASSDAIAAASMKAVVGPWAGKLIALTILVSTFSAANSVVLSSPRVFYAMAQDKLFFQKLGEVHPRFRTPAAAVVSLGVWSAVLACAGKFAELIGGVIFIGWIFYGLGAASIFPLRRQSAGKALPYRVPGYPWTPIVFVVAATALVGNAVYLALRDPREFIHLAIAIVLFALGVPAYFLWRRTAREKSVSAPTD